MIIAPDAVLVSATQIQLWHDCPRKWGFKYVEKIQTPQHPAAALGAEVQDSQLDPYLATGRGFDFTRPSGEIAQALVPLLPKARSEGLRLRRKFLMPSPTGKFAYQGEFDLWAPSASCVPGLEHSTLQLLGDIKTTSNLNYAKTEETLKTDLQAQLYAMDVMFEENVDALDLVWFYVRTRKPHRVQRTHLRIAATHVVEQFEKIDESATALVAAKLANPKVDDLAPNARMCDAYGGCPYRSRCNLSPAVHAAAINTEALVESKTNDFLAGLRKTTAAPALPPVMSAEQVPAPEGIPAWLSKPADTSKPAAINPPESALPPAPPVGAAASVATEAPKAKRGRPPKSVTGASENVSELAPLDALPGLVEAMKALGVQKLVMNAGQICEVQLFDMAKS